MIKAYAAALKYIAVIAVSDYLEMDGENATINGLIGRQLERPSLGHWRGWVREFGLWAQKYPNHVLAPLFNLPETIADRAGVIMDSFVTFRNQHVHPDWFPDPDESREILDERIPEFDELLGYLKPVLDRRLLLCTTPYEAKVCSGIDATAFEPANPLPPGIDPTKSFLFLEREDQPVLPIETLLLWHSVNDENETSGPDGVYVYETLAGSKASYFNANYRLIKRGSTAKHTRELAKGLRAAARAAEGQDSPTAPPGTTGLSLDVLRERAAHNYEFLRTNGFMAAFLPSLYVERESDEGLNQFLEQDQTPLLLLLAKSGAGKTNLVCHLAHSGYDALRRGRTNDAEPIVVFLGCARHVPGTDVDAFFGNLLKLHMPLSQALPTMEPLFAAGAAKLVIVLDAVNEHESPVELWLSLVELARRVMRPWLRIVTSSRPMAWEHMRNAMREEDRRLLFWNGRNEALVLDDYTNTEFQTAYAKYANYFLVSTPCDAVPADMRAMLHDPLMMRLTFEAYKGSYEGAVLQMGDLPTSGGIEFMLTRYVDRSLRDQDRPFVTHLIRAMWEVARDHLTLGLLDSEALRSIPADPDNPDAGSIGERLKDHVFGDPVFEVQRVYRCTSPTCDQHNRPILPEFSADREDLESGRCPACSMYSLISEACVQGDLRTAFDRCRDEGVIQTAMIDGPEGEDMRISFVYDRVCEFLLAQRLRAEAHGDPGQVANFYVAAAERSSHCQQLWNGVRDALVAELVASEPGFTLADLSVSGSGAMRSMIAQSLVVVGQPDPDASLALLDAAVAKASRNQRRYWHQIRVRVAAELGVPEVVRDGLLNGSTAIRNDAAIALLTLWHQSPTAAYDALTDLASRLSILHPLRSLRILSGFPAAIIILACEANLMSDADRRQQELTRLGVVFKTFLARAVMMRNGKPSLITRLLVALVRSAALRVLVLSRNSHDQNYMGEYKAVFRRMTEDERKMFRCFSALFGEVEDPESFLPDLFHCATQDYMIPTTIFMTTYALRHPERGLPLAEKFFAQALDIVPMNPECHSQIGWGFYLAFLSWQNYIEGGVTHREYFDGYFKLYGRSLRRYLLDNRCRLRSGVKEGEPGDTEGLGGGWFMVIYCVLYSKALGPLAECPLLLDYCNFIHAPGNERFALDHVECMHRALAFGGEREQLEMLTVVLDEVGKECIAPGSGSDQHKRLLEFFARVQRTAPEALSEFFGAAVSAGMLRSEDQAAVQTVESAVKIGDLVSQRSNRFFVDQLCEKNGFLQRFLIGIIDDITRCRKFSEVVEIVLFKLLAECRE